MDVNSSKVLELEVVDAKIRAGERLVAEQELRIWRLRTLGIDEVSDPDVIDLAGPNRAPGVLARLDSPT